MRIIFVVLCLTTTMAMAQGKYITLSQEDAQKAEQLQKSVEAAQKAQADFRQYVREHYTEEKIHFQKNSYYNLNTVCGSNSDCLEPKSGWESGFKFSDDFKLILPEHYVIQSYECPPTNTCPACPFAGGAIQMMPNCCPTFLH